MPPRFSFSAALLLLIALGWSLCSLPAEAQTQRDGSPYSRFGLGMLQFYTSPQAEALGGGAYGLSSFNYVNYANPPLWSDQVLTGAMLGVRYTAVNATNDEGETSRLSQSALNAFQLSFPIYRQKLGAAIAFRPYSRSSYRIRRPGTLRPDPSNPDSTVAYEVNFEGGGGLQQITGGLGYRLNEAVSVGASVNVIFGIIENRRRTTFDLPLYQDAIRTAGTRLLGVTGTLGAHVNVPGVLGEEDLLAVGAAVTLPTRLHGARTFTLGQSLDRDTLRSAEGSVRLPARAVLGLTYQPDERWTVVADGLYAPWSRFESTFSGAFALPGQNALGDRLRLSAGTEFVPAGTDLTEPYLRRTAYRLGLYYEQTYLRLPTVPAGADTEFDTADNAINTLAVTGGLSLPTIVPGTRIDLNMEAGTRGAATGILVRDTFYSVTLTVNFGERWFRERKLR